MLYSLRDVMELKKEKKDNNSSVYRERNREMRHKSGKDRER